MACMIKVLPALEGDDQRALTLADGGHQIDDPAGHLVRRRFELEPLLRIQRGELGEVRSLPDPIRIATVDGVDPHHRIELLLAFALARRTDHTSDQVSLTQAELLDHRQGDVRVVGARQIAVGADEGVIVEDIQDAASRDEHIVFGNHRLVVAFEIATTAAVTPVLAIPTTPPTTAAAAAFLVPVAALVVSALVVSALIVALLVLAPLTLVAPSAVLSVVLPILASSVGPLAIISAALSSLLSISSVGYLLGVATVLWRRALRGLTVVNGLDRLVPLVWCGTCGLGRATSSGCTGCSSMCASSRSSLASRGARCSSSSAVATSRLSRPSWGLRWPLSCPT